MSRQKSGGHRRNGSGGVAGCAAGAGKGKALVCGETVWRDVLWERGRGVEGGVLGVDAAVLGSQALSSHLPLLFFGLRILLLAKATRK